MSAESLIAGARLFDAGQFFEAHEAWEQHWLVETDETRRRVLQGLIQVAAAFHKLLIQNQPESAERLFAKGLAKLDACPGPIDGPDLALFRDGVRACASELAAGRFDRSMVPKLATS